MKNFLGYLLLSMLTCGCESTPQTPIDDPRAALTEMVKADLSRCYNGKKAYCFDDTLEADTEALLKKWKLEPLPTKPSKLQKVVTRIVMRLRSDAIGSEESRTKLIKKVDDRFRDPKTAVVENAAFADFGHLPGTFVPHRQSFRLRTAEEYAGFYPKGRALAEAFAIVRKRHPDVDVLAIRFKLDGPTSGTTWKFALNKSGGLTIINGGDIWVTSFPISPDFSELTRSEKWMDDSIRCNGESPPPVCIGLAYPRFGFQKVDEDSD